MSTQPTAMPDMSTASGGFVEDRMADRFSGALSTDSEPSQADPVETPAPSPDNAPEITEPETSEPEDATAPEPEAAASEEEIDPYADLDDLGDQTAIEKFLTTPRGREIYANHKLVEGLAKPTTQGGIGHVPSVQKIREYFDDHRYTVALRSDFTSGDPARIGKFLAHWFAPDRPGAMAALQHLEPALATFGAEAYGQIAAPIMTRYEKSLIDKYHSTPDQGLKDALYQAVQIVHKDLTEEWLPESVFKNGRAQPQNPERDQIASEWQRLNAAKQAAFREARTQWDSKLQSAEAATLNGEIDKALKPLHEMRAKTPELYESLKERMAKQVHESLRSDPAIWGLYQAKVDAARKTGNPAAVEAVMKDFLALAVPAIRDKRGTFLKGAGVVIKQQNGDRHAQLRSIASHVAPSNNGAPPKRSVVPASVRRPGESNEDYRERRMLEAMAI